MEKITEFFSFSDTTILTVTLGSILLGILGSVVGVFTYLRKRVLIGDVIAHSVLPGLVLGFLVLNEKSFIVLLIGALISGGLSSFLVDYITHHSKLKTDAALALVLGVFFGFGTFLLTKLQGHSGASQAGIDAYLFGQAAAIDLFDVQVIGVCCVLLLLTLLIFFRGFNILSFDEQFAYSIGMPTQWLKFVLTSMTIITVALGVQLVGVVLMSALLITPTSAARFWTSKVKIMLLLAALFGAFGGLSGALISSFNYRMPTGPWIVIVLSFLAFLSFVFAPKKGVLFRLFSNVFFKIKIQKENILKDLFLLENETIEIEELQEHQPSQSVFNRWVQRILVYEKKIKKMENRRFTLTALGRAQGSKIFERHKLWEKYIGKYMHLMRDHVHTDAEGIEHIIDEEIERDLKSSI